MESDKIQETYGRDWQLESYIHQVSTRSPDRANTSHMSKWSGDLCRLTSGDNRPQGQILPYVPPTPFGSPVLTISHPPQYFASSAPPTRLYVVSCIESL